MTRLGEQYIPTLARLVNSLKVRRSEQARERCGFRQSGCLTVWAGRLDMKKAGEGRVDEIKATFSAQLLLLFVHFMEHARFGYYSLYPSKL